MSGNDLHKKALAELHQDKARAIKEYHAAQRKAVADEESELRMREDHHIAPEPAEEPPFCDRCFGHHRWDDACPEDEEE